VNDIHIVETMKLEQFSAARAYEAAFIMEPVKIKGGTGSTIAPIAVRWGAFTRLVFRLLLRRALSNSARLCANIPAQLR